MKILNKDICLYPMLYVSERMRDDREFVMKSVKLFGAILKMASERLKEDKELVL